MAVIKAADILAQVTKAKARVTYMDTYFSRETANEEHSVSERLNLAMAHAIQLDSIAEGLRDYVRKLPAPVQNKQVKACAQAKAYAQHICDVHVPASRDWLKTK